MCKVKFNKRFFGLLLAVVCVLGIIPSTTVTVSALDYSTGGCATILQSADVYDEHYNVIGTVDPGEGVTIISSSSIGFYIEYNTFDGPRQGHIDSRYALVKIDSAYGVVTESSTTYYSPDGLTYAGSVSKGENVGVLCDNGSWAYIEYNVSGAMRKRAFIQSSKIHSYSNGASNLFYHQNPYSDIIYPMVYSTTTVYSGPNGASYAPMGSVDQDDNGSMVAYENFYDKDGDLMYYIKYRVTGTNNYKYGYIYA